MQGRRWSRGGLAGPGELGQGQCRGQQAWSERAGLGHTRRPRARAYSPRADAAPPPVLSGGGALGSQPRHPCLSGKPLLRGSGRLEAAQAGRGVEGNSSQGLALPCPLATEPALRLAETGFPPALRQHPENMRVLPAGKETGPPERIVYKPPGRGSSGTGAAARLAEAPTRARWPGLPRQRHGVCGVRAAGGCGLDPKGITEVPGRGLESRPLPGGRRRAVTLQGGPWRRLGGRAPTRVET